MSFASKLKFSELSDRLDKVSNAEVPSQREKLFRNFFEELIKLRDKFRDEHPNRNSSLLPVIRLILSQEEKERSYGIQEKSLRKLYIEVIGLRAGNSDYDKIMKCSEDELPHKVEDVLKSRLSEDNRGTLSIEQVDNLLSFFSDNQKHLMQRKELEKIYLKASATDHKWICRFILKRMSLTMGAATILGTLHPNAKALFKKFNHVSKIVEIIDNGLLDDVTVTEGVKPFENIKSMLCEKIADRNKGLLANVNKIFYCETKMDGERFQLHYKDGEFQYFSRNGHSYNEGFNALLSPLIKFNGVVHSLILDGEMMVFDSDTNTYRTKGDTSVDVKAMKASTAKNLRPCFCAFDVLYYNGSPQITKPFHERMDILNDLFTDRVGVLVKSKPIKIRNVDHMIDMFNVAIGKFEEGIVIKSANSHYQPGERGGGWYKIKADYFDGDLVKDFDCVVIGGYYENANTKNFIQKFMLGAVEKRIDEKFNIHAIGTVHSGLDRSESDNLNRTLKANAIAHRGESEVEFDSGKVFFGLVKPDVWIPPNHSVVLEIRASELSKTSEMTTPYTFRFPRIINIRKDKSWDESCTLKEFEDIYKDQEQGKVQKLTRRNATASDMQPSPSRKRKAVESREDQLKKFQHEHRLIDDVETLDDVLEGKEFCVKSSNIDLPPVNELVKIIKSHGGTIVAHPRAGKTFAIISNRLSSDITKYTNVNNKDMNLNVIKPEWIVRELQNKSLAVIPTVRPKFDMIFTTDKFLEEVSSVFDRFGDSFLDKIETVEDLQKMLSLNPAEGGIEFDEDMIADLERELEEVCGLKNVNIFRRLHAYFASDTKNQFLNCSQKLFELFKGKVIDELDDSPDLMIICDKKEKLSIPERMKSSLIDHNWILDSIDAGKLLDKELYLVQK